MTMDDNQGGGASPVILMLLVVVAVFAGILFALWLFGAMTAG
jgi:hypothetical protein